ncbi:MAG: tetratricopeptide repeat protein [Candidatus Sericytochromatia bacterium]
MFGLSKLVNKITAPAPLKVIASNNFVSALDSINKVKNETLKEQEDKRLSESKVYFEKARALFELCKTSNNYLKEDLKKIADYLLKSIDNNKNNPDAYLNLAYIFYLMNKTNLSVKYMRIAQEMNPKLDGIELLKSAISNQKIVNETKPKYQPEEKIQEQKVVLNKLTALASSRVKNAYGASIKRF